jgi:hypothetical protein
LLKESDDCSAAQARVAQERQHGGDPAVGELLHAQAGLVKIALTCFSTDDLLAGAKT